MDTINDLIEALILATPGKARAVAELLDVDESSLSKVRKHTRNLGLDPLLRLARVAGRPPDEVLRMAGKTDDLAFLTQFFGPSARIVVSFPRDMEMLCANIRALDDDDRHAVEQLIKRFRRTGPSTKRGSRVARKIPRRRVG